jgi:glycosyltransferase involved in cell wall biosynthesis
MVGSAHLNIAYEERLRALSNDQVIFTGAVYGDSLTGLWNGAYAVIHPSMTEGMSLSLLEAMAHSRCIIVSDIPENLEVIGEGALTFRTGDVGDLARVITEIDGDPDAAGRYGARALARARESFDWQKIVDRLEMVYVGT